WGGMIEGTIGKVDALQMPETRNRNRNMAKKPVQLPALRKKRTPATPTAMPANTQKVTRPPPHLSDTQPVSERETAPTRGPRNAYASALTSGNWVLASSGNPAE